MCSIFAYLNLDAGQPDPQLRETALRHSRRQRHRGPDWSGTAEFDQSLLVHERLAIVDLDHGAQPLYSADGTLALAVNGEIYNHREIRASLPDYDFATGSDCEVILPLYMTRGTDFLNDLNGIFAFVLVNRESGEWLIARDPIGVVPLYYGHDEKGRLLVASELKAIHDLCDDATIFPPGHFQTQSDSEPQRYFRPSWRDYDRIDGSTSVASLRPALEDAVHRQLMSDVPYGVLLSGGLDSSVIAAIAARMASRRIEDNDHSAAWWPRLHTFSVGLDGSPDLKAARVVADHIDSVHHELHYTIAEGIDALEEVIWHLETFDVTTIRASTPMYLMARKIRAMGIKMVLSGEGADEIFGGYLYFHKAPDDREFHAETVRKLDALHQFDCLRANKAMAAWSVEARVPFLDRDFLNTAMNIPSSQKMITGNRIEKHVLRESCADLLPDEIVWRQKEQFSDGVGYGWIDSLKDNAEQRVSDDDMKRATELFPISPPLSKEALLYRRIFEQHFPSEAAARTVPYGRSVACSSPAAIRWDASFQSMNEPSGRSIASVHKDAY